MYIFITSVQEFQTNNETKAIPINFENEDEVSISTNETDALARHFEITSYYADDTIFYVDTVRNFMTDGFPVTSVVTHEHPEGNSAKYVISTHRYKV